MASQDRSYYRDSQDGRPSPLVWLLGGSIQVLSAGGMRVRLHAVAVLTAIAYLVAGIAIADFPQRLLTIGAILVLVVLHETGHCIAARMLGGYADDVLLWPLGGLADPQPPHRPLPVLITTMAGPLVNAAICIACLVTLRWMHQPGPTTFNPFAIAPPPLALSDPRFYLLFVFGLSYLLLLLNLLPILPLDGGRALQCMLWPFVGYARALVSANHIGIAVAAAVAAFALLSVNGLLFCVALACLVISVQRRMVVKTAAAWNHGDLDIDVQRPRRRHLSRFTKWRARRQIRREEAEFVQVDQILIKVHQGGMHSLSWRERRLLRRATAHQRQRDMEDSFHST